MSYKICSFFPKAFLIFLSVLYWLKEYTDHKAAGNQPMRVSCKIRQMIPEMGLPMVKKFSQGSKIAKISLMRKVPLFFVYIISNTL